MPQLLYDNVVTIESPIPKGVLYTGNNGDKETSLLLEFGGLYAITDKTNSELFASMDFGAHHKDEIETRFLPFMFMPVGATHSYLAIIYYVMGKYFDFESIKPTTVNFVRTNKATGKPEKSETMLQYVLSLYNSWNDYALNVNLDLINSTKMGEEFYVDDHTGRETPIYLLTKQLSHRSVLFDEHNIKFTGVVLKSMDMWPAKSIDDWFNIFMPKLLHKNCPMARPDKQLFIRNIKTGVKPAPTKFQTRLNQTNNRYPRKDFSDKKLFLPAQHYCNLPDYKMEIGKAHINILGLNTGLKVNCSLLRYSAHQYIMWIDLTFGNFMKTFNGHGIMFGDEYCISIIDDASCMAVNSYSPQIVAFKHDPSTTNMMTKCMQIVESCRKHEGSEHDIILAFRSGLILRLLLGQDPTTYDASITQLYRLKNSELDNSPKPEKGFFGWEAEAPKLQTFKTEEEPIDKYDEDYESDEIEPSYDRESDGLTINDLPEEVPAVDLTDTLFNLVRLARSKTSGTHPLVDASYALSDDITTVSITVIGILLDGNYHKLKSTAEMDYREAEDVKIFFYGINGFQFVALKDVLGSTQFIENNFNNLIDQEEKYNASKIKSKIKNVFKDGTYVKIKQYPEGHGVLEPSSKPLEQTKPLEPIKAGVRFLTQQDLSDGASYRYLPGTLADIYDQVVINHRNGNNEHFGLDTSIAKPDQRFICITPDGLSMNGALKMLKPFDKCYNYDSAIIDGFFVTPDGFKFVSTVIEHSKAVASRKNITAIIASEKHFYKQQFQPPIYVNENKPVVTEAKKVGLKPASFDDDSLDFKTWA